MEEFRKKGMYYIGFALLVLVQNINSQSINFENINYPKATISLGYHFSDGIYKIMDVQSDDRGMALFLNDTMHSGMYYILLPDSSSFEFLYDKNFPGKISISSNHSNDGYSVSGSAPASSYNKHLSLLATNSANKKNKDELIDSFLKEDNNSILTSFLTAHKKIDIPDYTPPTEIVNKDSAIWSYKLAYHQKHFLDHVDLSDDRLIYTPIYTLKMNQFLDKNIKQESNEISKAVDFVIAKTKDNLTSQEFTTNYLARKYHQRKNYPIYERVYVELINRHFLESGYEWINNEMISHATDEYKRYFPASLGEKAPNISGVNTSNKAIDLYNTSNDYTILYLYDYECPLCKKLIPSIKKLMGIYDYLNLNTFAFCFGENKDDWKDYVSRNKLNKWSNVWDETQNSQITRNYNLDYTPSIFLLDKDKRIIGKNLNMSQLEKALLKEAIRINERP